MATATHGRESMQATQPTAPYAIAIAEQQVIVAHPRHGDIKSSVRIQQRIGEAPNGFLCHGMFRTFGLLHEFRVLLEPRTLALYLTRGPSNPSKRAVHRAWCELSSLGSVAPHRRHVMNDDRLVVAHVLVNEIPSRIAREHGPTWAGLWDEDPGLRRVFRHFDKLSARDDGATVRRPLQHGGSVLWVQALEVHPAFTGQRIGGRLLLHTLWALVRHSGDLAYLEAYPDRVFFTHRSSDPASHCTVRSTPAELARLLGFYERVGFSRVDDKARDPRRAVPTYRHVGAFGIPVNGVGELSVLAGHHSDADVAE